MRLLRVSDHLSVAFSIGMTVPLCDFSLSEYLCQCMVFVQRLQTHSQSVQKQKQNECSFRVSVYCQSQKRRA